jgi:hypothetical protein
VAIDDVYSLTMLQTSAGQRTMNTLYFRMKAATDPTSATIAVLANSWKEMLRTHQHIGLSYTTWIMQQVRGGTVTYPVNQCKRTGGRRVEGPFTGSLAGDIALQDMLPPQSAVVTTLNTGISGRSRRGRLYMGGVPEYNQSNGTVNSAEVSALQTAWDTQLTQYGAGGTDPNFELGVFSMTIATGCKPAKNPPFSLEQVQNGDAAAAYLGVISATVRSIVYSQRKRTIGVGR